MENISSDIVNAHAIFKYALKLTATHIFQCATVRNSESTAKDKQKIS